MFALLFIIAFVPGVMLLAPLSIFLPDDLETMTLLRAIFWLSAVFYVLLIVGGAPNPLPMFYGASGIVVTLMVARKVSNGD